MKSSARRKPGKQSCELPASSPGQIIIESVEPRKTVVHNPQQILDFE